MELHTTEQLPTSTPAPGLEGGAYSLLVVRNGSSSVYALPASGKVLVGRAPHADIRIDHGSVSREHARFELGETITLADLGSANGTRVRGARLEPERPEPIALNETIDLGEVLLVVRCRRLEPGASSICAPAVLELRLAEECERARTLGTNVGVATFHVEGELDARAVELVIAAELSPRDLLATPETNRYEVLFLDRPRPATEADVERIAARLRARGLAVRERLVTRPADGDDARSLLGRTVAPVAPAGPRAYGELIVEDPAMLRVCRLLERVGASELSVLLLGETGVGKEMCAELVHASSPRRRQRVLRLNCAALVESLLESELFGHERGAFTGAVSDKVGLLESASGGSVFLDEVGDMPLSTQVKLLRVLEAKEVLRIGSSTPRPLDVRLIAATNRDLQERITAGLFREDLYYRLNGISVLVPPLRDRPADIVPLARHFAERAEPGGSARLGAAALADLQAQRWAGNVRELKNAVTRALVLAETRLVGPEHFGVSADRGALRTSVSGGLRDEVEALERERIERALKETGGSQRRAAARLGISRGALLRRLAQYGLVPQKGG